MNIQSIKSSFAREQKRKQQETKKVVHEREIQLQQRSWLFFIFGNTEQ